MTRIQARSFGTAPVFFAAISTILGAVMFLRFGYAVGHVGLLGTLGIIFLGHCVTIPTAMAIAEIATNQKVEGGGEYYIISRSFGLTIGGAIGVGLFLSQAISAAFYLIAFAEGFDPILSWLHTQGWPELDKRIISIPAMLILSTVMLKKGADLGVKMLYTVVGILFVSLIIFFLGSSAGETFEYQGLTHTVKEPMSFFYVFAICFPAFTGMTAGVGLSGDLRNPKKSIPLGTLSATLGGMVIYVLIAWKLASSLPPEILAEDQLAMSRIALWGPAIPIGLICATLSSALGSLLVAPRTLQAIGQDGLLPSKSMNQWLAAGSTDKNEPVNASLIACGLALIFLAVGDVNAVAEVISMFFMVTYGSICLISFLEHFSADPSYRPTFTSRWWVSLFGAVACIWLMFEMNAVYAFASILMMGVIYFMIAFYNPDKKGLTTIFQGVISQVSRRLLIFLQGATESHQSETWRPSIVCISEDSFHRRAAFELVRWISHQYGFGTYIHFVKGYLSRDTAARAVQNQNRLIRQAFQSRGRVYVDTMVSPSHTTAVCQVIQLPGISGHENNGILFEFPKNGLARLETVLHDMPLVRACGFDIYMLASSERNFGYRREIHIWITSQDYENAGLMILMSYVIAGHPDWRQSTIRLFASFSKANLVEREKQLRLQIQAGRLPISQHNIQIVPQEGDKDFRSLVNHHSSEADLVIVGMRWEALKRFGKELFKGFDAVGDMLFINAGSEKELANAQELADASEVNQAEAGGGESEEEVAVIEVEATPMEAAQADVSQDTEDPETAPQDKDAGNGKIP